MVLIGIENDNLWIRSHWKLTYPVGWTQIQKAACAAFDYYNGAEVIVNGTAAVIKKKEEIMNIPEGMNLTLRGNSGILKIPLSITYYNQLADVHVSAAKLSREFSAPDYESFNKSLAQYLSSIELAMYR